MEELVAAEGLACATDQILYNLTRCGPRRELLPWLRRRTIPTMAYSPVQQGRLLASGPLKFFAERKGVPPAQVALAWLLLRDDVIAIPEAGSVGHVRENREAADRVLDDTYVADFERAFPRPTRTRPIELA